MIRPRRVGADARTSRLDYNGPLRGSRLLLRCPPEEAVRLAVDQLAAQGFVMRDDGYDRHLRAQASPWTAAALEIGDAKRSKRTFWTGLIADEFPFPLPKALQHALPPTLVVAAARHGADGVTELVVYPHTSRHGDPEYAFAAAPRVAGAIDGIVAAATGAGVLVSNEVMRGIANDGSPASQAAVREVLGWR